MPKTLTSCEGFCVLEINEPKITNNFLALDQLVEGKKKNMFVLQNFSEQRQYVPAVLKHTDGCGWYIEYSTLNQFSVKMERHRLHLNRERERCSSLSEFRMMAQLKVQSINNQLANAFLITTQMHPELQMAKPILGLPATATTTSAAPIQDYGTQAAAMLSERPSSRFFTPIEEVLDAYEDAKKAELSKTTMRSYSTFVHQFKKWIHKKAPQLQCYMFTQELAMMYLDYVYKGNTTKDKKYFHDKLEGGHVSARTYNNTIKLSRAFFSWAKENCYTGINPFSEVKAKKTKEKGRTIIPQEDREAISAYFRKHNPAMELIARIVYVSLLRPVEISRIRVGQINFEQHCIDINCDQTKNGKARAGRLDTELEELLRIYIGKAKSTDYLFGSGRWRPGKAPMNSHVFSKAWQRMRDVLKYPETYQLYSLRDSGIHDLLRAGVPTLDAMQAAGHSDLNMTTRYADHHDPNLIKRLNETAPKF